MQNNVISWIDEWVTLYPKDIEFNGRLLRSTVKDCVNKMQKFVKDNPNYTKDVIFAATKRYLAEQESRNWAYTKQSTYFISKLGEPSVLANYCEKILAGIKPVEVIPDYNQIDDYI